MLVYTMDYTSLEEAYGSSFAQRSPITQQSSSKANDKPLTASKSIEQRGAESVEKHKGLVDSVKKTIGFDNDPTTESFAVQQETRERFTSSQPANVAVEAAQADKLSRILRLIEQNKTGYERPAIQDMVLYIATGIFFLFTFDTFVVLGKSMRGK
jgi:hypothetical protein